MLPPSMLATPVLLAALPATMLAVLPVLRYTLRFQPRQINRHADYQPLNRQVPVVKMDGQRVAVDSSAIMSALAAELEAAGRAPGGGGKRGL